LGTVETMVGSLKVSAKDMSTVETMVGSLKVSAKDISTVETMGSNLQIFQHGYEHWNTVMKSTAICNFWFGKN